MRSANLRQTVMAAMIVLLLAEYGHGAGETARSPAEEEARGEMEARLERMKEQAPDFSLTVFPVLINQIEKQDLVPGVAKAMALLFEGAGVKRIEVSDDFFRPTAPRDAWKIAREFGGLVNDKSIETDYAVFAEFIGTPETGPDEIFTVVVDKAGNPVWVGIQTRTDPLVKGIKQHTPFTCCYVSVEKLRRRLGLTVPTGKDSVKGKWSRYFDEKARKRAAQQPDAREK